MVAEVIILLGIQHFEQRRRRITSEIISELVDFIQHDDRIAGARLLHRLDETTRHRPHVGTTMTPNFSLVAHAPQRDPNKLASHGPGNGSTQRRFPYTGRSRKAKDGSATVVSKTAHTEVFQNSILDRLQMRVIGIENLPGIVQIEAIRRAAVPGQIHHPVKIVPNHLSLGAIRMHPLQTTQLTSRFLLAVGGELRFLDLHPIFIELIASSIVFTQFGLDGAKLLPKKGLPFFRGHLLFGLGLFFGLQARRFEFTTKQTINFAETYNRILDFQDTLRLSDGERQMGGDEISQSTRSFDGGDHRENFRRKIFQGQQLLNPASNRTKQILGLGVPLELIIVRQRRGAHPKGVFILNRGVDSRLGDPLNDGLDPAILEPSKMRNGRNGPHCVKTIGSGIRILGVSLHHQHDEAMARHGVVEHADRLRAGHEKRQRHVGEQHELAQGEHRQLVGKGPQRRCDFRHTFYFDPAGSGL